MSGQTADRESPKLPVLWQEKGVAVSVQHATVEPGSGATGCGFTSERWEAYAEFLFLRAQYYEPEESDDPTGKVSVLSRRHAVVKSAKTSEGLGQELTALSMTVLLLFILAVGCGEQDPRLHRLFSRMVKQADLPSGWFVAGGGVDDRDQPDKGILARWMEFRGVPESVFPTVLVIHWLIDYPDGDQARAAYEQAVTEEFPVTRLWTTESRVCYHLRSIFPEIEPSTSGGLPEASYRRPCPLHQDLRIWQMETIPVSFQGGA
jgi:hypothetical protein